MEEKNFVSISPPQRKRGQNKCKSWKGWNVWNTLLGLAWPSLSWNQNSCDYTHEMLTRLDLPTFSYEAGREHHQTSTWDYSYLLHTHTQLHIILPYLQVVLRGDRIYRKYKVNWRRWLQWSSFGVVTHAGMRLFSNAASWFTHVPINNLNKFWFIKPDLVCLDPLSI